MNKLCSCGCGNPVTKKWAKYIKGHRKKKVKSPPCPCCGVKMVRNINWLDCENDECDVVGIKKGRIIHAAAL